MIPALLWVQISESLNTTSLQVVDTVLSGTENAALNDAASDSLNNATSNTAASTESGDGWWQWLLELKDTLSIPLFSLANTQVTLMSLTVFILLLLGFIVGASYLKRLLRDSILPKFIHDQGLQYTLARMSQYTLVVVGVLISFQFLGVDFTGLAVIFGFLSVGIGFGLQNITSNFISGLIVLFERPISVGDRVMVNGIEGDIEEINIRATKVKTLENISIIVPNSDFVSKDVINYSHGDPTFKLVLDVGVAYDSNLDDVLKALEEVAQENKTVMKRRKHHVHLRSFGDSAWNMKLIVWIPDVKERYTVQNELNQAIVRKFRERNIEIPFPQHDLHIRSGLSNQQD
jgi:small-conductance mechanosensitive channel